MERRRALLLWRFRIWRRRPTRGYAPAYGGVCGAVVVVDASFIFASLRYRVRC